MIRAWRVGVLLTWAAVAGLSCGGTQPDDGVRILETLSPVYTVDRTYRSGETRPCFPAPLLRWWSASPPWAHGGSGRHGPLGRALSGRRPL